MTLIADTNLANDYATGDLPHDVEEINSVVEAWNQRDGAWPAEWTFDRFGNLEIIVCFSADAGAFHLFDSLLAFTEWTDQYRDIELTEGVNAA